LSEKGWVRGSFLEARHANLKIAKRRCLLFCKHASRKQETERKKCLEEHHDAVIEELVYVCIFYTFGPFSMEEDC
jgi:ethanolamine utilization cobalamin adenosyltransferase